MQYVRDASGSLSLATPEAYGTCPQCAGDMIARCGDINVWHWAHAKGNDCDTWSEPESEWHKEWKEGFVPGVSCEVTRGHHRADIVTATGTVVELQHSHLSNQERREREAFYINMIWLLDGAPFAERFEIEEGHEDDDFFGGDDVVSITYGFTWKRPHKTWLYARKPVFIDLPDGIFQIQEIETEEEWVESEWGSRLQKTTYGIGRWIEKTFFKNRLLSTFPLTP